MWKLAAGFIAFAAVAMWLLAAGSEVDISGEKHGIEASPAPVSTAASNPS